MVAAAERCVPGQMIGFFDNRDGNRRGVSFTPERSGYYFPPFSEVVSVLSNEVLKPPRGHHHEAHLFSYRRRSCDTGSTVRLFRSSCPLALERLKF